MKKLLYLFFFIAFSFFLIPSVILAADFRASENGNVAVEKNQQAKNLYIAGKTVSIDGTVAGDLVAAGSNVSINGSVENSSNVAGSTVIIDGIVGGSARLVGSSITIDGTVKQDLFAAGSDITISKDALIQGDLIAAGSTTSIQGIIDGDAKLTGDTVIISGNIKGNVSVKGVNKLTVKDGAVIEGNLSYSSPNTADIQSGASIKGKVDYTESSGFSGRHLNRNISSASFLLQIAGLFVFLLVLIYLLPKFSRLFVENSYKSFGQNLGWGFLLLIVVPIAFIILLTLVATAGIAFSLFLLYALYLILAYVFGGLLLGSGLLRLFRKDDAYTVDWLTALLGAVVFAVLGRVPVVGGLVVFVFFLVGLGTFFQFSVDFVKSNHK